VSTLVCFHAHPDDECIRTAGVMAAAAKAGHRVVLVVATGGELGESPDDLAPGETLADRRRAETMKSAEILGVQRVEWLGYHDSGMAGWEQNDAAGSFWSADVDEAAARLAALLTEEAADVLTVYDQNGDYGHPDHIQVHRVGHRAADKAGTPVVYEATFNREESVRGIKAAIARGDMKLEDVPELEGEFAIGTPEALLTTRVDVRPWIDHKRRCLTSHASQSTDTSFMLDMPAESFVAFFGTEWFVRKGAPPGIHEDTLAGLGPTA
jgi:LmbE family N-acetylglucosaminyl deacetylase